MKGKIVDLVVSVNVVGVALLAISLIIVPFSTTEPFEVENRAQFDNIVNHAFMNPPSYMVRKSGSDYEAINGDTDKIDFGGSTDMGV